MPLAIGIRSAYVNLILLLGFDVLIAWMLHIALSRLYSAYLDREIRRGKTIVVCNAMNSPVISTSVPYAVERATYVSNKTRLSPCYKYYVYIVILHIAAALVMFVTFGVDGSTRELTHTAPITHVFRSNYTTASWSRPGEAEANSGCFIDQKRPELSANCRKVELKENQTLVTYGAIGLYSASYPTTDELTAFCDSSKRTFENRTCSLLEQDRSMFLAEVEIEGDSDEDDTFTVSLNDESILNNRRFTINIEEQQAIIYCDTQSCPRSGTQNERANCLWYNQDGRMKHLYVNNINSSQLSGLLTKDSVRLRGHTVSELSALSISEYMGCHRRSSMMQLADVLVNRGIEIRLAKEKVIHIPDGRERITEIQYYSLALMVVITVTAVILILVTTPGKTVSKSLMDPMSFASMAKYEALQEVEGCNVLAKDVKIAITNNHASKKSHIGVVAEGNGEQVMYELEGRACADIVADAVMTHNL